MGRRTLATMVGAVLLAAAGCGGSSASPANTPPSSQTRLPTFELAAPGSGREARRARRGWRSTGLLRPGHVPGRARHAAGGRRGSPAVDPRRQRHVSRDPPPRTHPLRLAPDPGAEDRHQRGLQTDPGARAPAHRRYVHVHRVHAQRDLPDRKRVDIRIGRSVGCRAPRSAGSRHEADAPDLPAWRPA